MKISETKKESGYGVYMGDVKQPDPVPCKGCGEEAEIIGQMICCLNRDCNYNSPRLNLSYDEWQERNTF